MRPLVALALSAIVAACVTNPAAALDSFRDEPSTMKFTMSSIPLLGGPDDGGDSCASGATEPDDEEYTTDSIGRRVPVRTHRSGSAISSR